MLMRITEDGEVSVKGKAYILEGLYKYVSEPVAKVLVHTSLTPNQITFIGFLLSVVAGALFSIGRYPYLLAGALVVELALLADFVDGDLARMSGMSSEFGEWLDDVLGTLNTVVFFFGITWGAYRQRQDPVAWMLGFAIVSGVLVIQFSNIIAWLLAFKRERKSSTDQHRLEKAELRSILKPGRLKKALMFVRVQAAPSIATIWTMASLAALLDQLYLFLLIGTIYLWGYFVFISFFTVRRYRQIGKGWDKPLPTWEMAKEAYDA